MKLELFQENIMKRCIIFHRRKVKRLIKRHPANRGIIYGISSLAPTRTTFQEQRKKKAPSSRYDDGDGHRQLGRVATNGRHMRRTTMHEARTEIYIGNSATRS
jgi:hypothetical protein